MEILIPSTFGAEERDDRLQVEKIGRILRASAIFGVDKITIYRDEDPKINENENSEFLKKNMEYGATPPYMRKKLFPFDEDLKYAGIIPPLRIPSHGYNKSEEQEKFREGVVVEKRGNQAFLEAGLDEKLKTEGLKEGKRVSVEIKGDNNCKVVDENEIPGFWNIEIKNDRRKLGKVLSDRKDKKIIGTSRKGDSIKEMESEVKNLEFRNSVLVFGSAWRGIFELAERDNFSTDLFDVIINTLPVQNTETVRTEEAVLVTLGIFNLWK